MFSPAVAPVIAWQPFKTNISANVTVTILNVRTIIHPHALFMKTPEFPFYFLLHCAN
jgi:hypothetical protein